MDLTFHLADFPVFGSIIQVTSKVGSTLLIVFLMYSPILLGFGFFFNWALGNSDTFDTTWKIVLKMIAMSIGELEIENFSQNQTIMGLNSVNAAPGMIEIVTILFIFIMCIVVTNMLIGLTISRTQYFMEQADLTRLSKSAHACKSFENIANYFNYKSKKQLSSIIIDLKPKPKSIWNDFWLRFVYAYGDVKDVSSSDYEAAFRYNDKNSDLQYCRQAFLNLIIIYLVCGPSMMAKEDQINGICSACLLVEGLEIPLI